MLNHSIQARASEPVAITPLSLSQLEKVMWRDRYNLQSTDFSFSRFLAPYLCDFEDYKDCGYADQWHEERQRMLYAGRERS